MEVKKTFSHKKNNKNNNKKLQQLNQPETNSGFWTNKKVRLRFFLHYFIVPKSFYEVL